MTYERCVVIGLGYIGLPTAAVIASRGVDVVGVDIRKSVVDDVNEGRCPIVEPGLPDLIASVVSSGRLRASMEIPKSDVFIIAVPTPFEGGYKPDLSYVKAAALSLAPVLERGNLVVVESTIPVGATEQVARWLKHARPDLSFARRNGDVGLDDPDVLIAHSPERILPGQMLRELVENDRVIGGICPKSSEITRAFYKRFVDGECVTTDSRTAELCKLTENAFRDVNIAFANELSSICEALDVNVWDLIPIANRHPRVNILKPGPGVGGHCIAIDPWFIVSAVSDQTRLIREARYINNGRPRQVMLQTLSAIKATGAKSVACFGLSYKPDVDDFRESPAVEVVHLLAEEIEKDGISCSISVIDPYLEAELPHELRGRDISRSTLEEALKSDVLVLLVDHKEYVSVSKQSLEGKTIIDTRGIWAKHDGSGKKKTPQPTPRGPHVETEGRINIEAAE